MAPERRLIRMLIVDVVLRVRWFKFCSGVWGWMQRFRPTSWDSTQLRNNALSSTKKKFKVAKPNKLAQEQKLMCTSQVSVLKPWPDTVYTEFFFFFIFSSHFRQTRLRFVPSKAFPIKYSIIIQLLDTVQPERLVEPLNKSYVSNTKKKPLSLKSLSKEGNFVQLFKLHLTFFTAIPL